MRSPRASHVPWLVANLFLAWAAALAIRAVVGFFGGLSVYPFSSAFLQVTRALVVPFGAATITSPYGGSFLTDTALTMMFLLLVEWVISSRATKRANQ